MKETPLKIRLNCILIEDPNGGYSAFLAELPDVVAEGDTEDEAQMNLLMTIQAVSKFKLQQTKKEFSQKANLHYRTKPLNFELEGV